jgi:chemotaxis protein histidine kinase CheA
MRIVVGLTNGSQTIGLAVDKVLRRQEIFIKDIQESVTAIPGVGGRRSSADCKIGCLEIVRRKQNSVLQGVANGSQK